MNINFKIKPTVVEAKTKEALLTKITQNHLFQVSSETGMNYVPMGRKDICQKVRVFNFQKFNKRTIGEKGRVKHWKAYVYDIPTLLLVMRGIIVEQGNRTFKIKSK